MNFAIYNNKVVVKGDTINVDGQPKTVIFAGRGEGRFIIRVKGQWIKIED